ncbi:MAG: phosphodiester glycosidase family protein [Erysipelotrichaceae bacterium]|nr:phosphodiester glycosidase family protein [Erysipelotrichaceae bacterium]
MSEKKSRVARYQSLHVTEEEFKKQGVAGEDQKSRLNQMAKTIQIHSVDVELTNENSQTMVDVKVDKDNVVEDMQTMQEFAKQVSPVEEDKTLFLVEDDPFNEDEELVVEDVEVDFKPIRDDEKEPMSDTATIDELVRTMDKDETLMPLERSQEEIDAIVKEVLDKMEQDEAQEEHVEPILNTEEEDEEPKEEVQEDPHPKKTKGSRWYFFGIGFFTFCNICALICFFVAYGPFSYVRDLFVTTAMSTMSHKYFANVLYSTETIQNILATNVTLEPDEIMDTNAIQIGNIQETQVYSSIYEEQVLKRDEGNDLYKVIRLDENGYKGYVTFVYDPTKIQLAVTRYLGDIGEYVTTMAKRTNAAVAINGGGFLDYGGNGSGGQAAGYIIQNGKVVWSRKRGGRWGGGTVGFNQEGVMILTKKRGKDAIKEGVYNGVDFGPFLIVNGKHAEVSGNGGWGINPRTVIGQRKDGIVVMLTVDGRSSSSLGIGLGTAIEIMERYDVYNAANMDGGASTVLAIEGKLMNKPVAYTVTGEREVPTAWVVVRD